jgi:hypothetical protein
MRQASTRVKRSPGATRPCNICHRPFKPKSRFQRFCYDCRCRNNDTYRFAGLEGRCGVALNYT